MPRSAALVFAVPALLFATGCASSLSQPFESLKSAPITVYRLQNYEPPPQQAAAAGTLTIPPQIQQWVTAGASLLPPGLLPPGLIPGAGAAAAPAQNEARFHDFRILGWLPLNDPKMHDDLLAVLGHDSSFTQPKENCMYAEFGVSIAQPNQPPADILVSLSCNQVRSFGFTWPYANDNGLTPDAEKQIVEIMKKAFGGG